MFYVARSRLEADRDQGQPESGEDAKHAARILDRVKERVAGLRATVVRRRGGLRVWRVAVAVVGSVVIAGGVILLVIPGPGWLVIFLGLGIWATEFAWARSLLSYTQRQVRKATGWLARRAGRQ